MLRIVRQLAPNYGQMSVIAQHAPLGAIRLERRDRNPDRHAGAAVVAIRAVREGAAAPKAQPDELAVDAGVDQVAGRGDLRARRAVGKVAAGIRRRRVELQRSQRKIVELAHRMPVLAVAAAPRSYRRQPGGGSAECINSARCAANIARGIGRAPNVARCAVSCWQSIERDAKALQLRNERDQRDLRRIRLVREHRFAEEHAPERDAVEAADEPPVAPALDRVRIAPPVQLAIRIDHLRRDPGAALPLPRRARARADDRAEVGVDARLERAGAHPLAQRARHAELRDVQHHARIGAPPQDRLAVRVPRKDALAIGGDDALGRQVRAGGQQAVGLGERGLERRKGRLRRKPRDQRGPPGSSRRRGPRACAAVATPARGADDRRAADARPRHGGPRHRGGAGTRTAGARAGVDSCETCAENMAVACARSAKCRHRRAFR